MTAIAVAAYIVYQRVSAAIRLRRLRDKNRVDRIVESLRARKQENVAFYVAPKKIDDGKAVYLDDQGRAHQWADDADEALRRVMEKNRQQILRMFTIQKRPVETQRHADLRKRLDEGNKS